MKAIQSDASENSRIRQAERRNRGFTLIELLVVVAIIGILAALLLSAISGAKERAIRVKCLNNVRQLTLASLAYALDWRDRLPTVDYGGSPTFLGGAPIESFVKTYCAMRDVYYDPGYPELNTDINWLYSPFQGTRVIGYAVTFPGSGLKPEYINTFGSPQPFQVGNVLLPRPVASDRVLIAGIVVSGPGQNNPNPAFRTNYNFTNVIVGTLDANNDYHGPPLRTSHLKRGQAVGDNFGMLDGSARWRKFSAMLPRSDPPNGTIWW